MGEVEELDRVDERVLGRRPQRLDRSATAKARVLREAHEHAGRVHRPVHRVARHAREARLAAGAEVERRLAPPRPVRGAARVVGVVIARVGAALADVGIHRHRKTHVAQGTMRHADRDPVLALELGARGHRHAVGVKRKRGVDEPQRLAVALDLDRRRRLIDQRMRNLRMHEPGAGWQVDDQRLALRTLRGPQLKIQRRPKSPRGDHHVSVGVDV